MDTDTINKNTQANINPNNSAQTQAHPDVLEQQLVDRFVASGMKKEDAIIQARQVLNTTSSEINTAAAQDSKFIPTKEENENIFISKQIIQKAIEKGMINANAEAIAREVLTHTFEEMRGKDIQVRTRSAIDALNRYSELNKKNTERHIAENIAANPDPINPFSSLKKTSKTEEKNVPPVDSTQELKTDKDPSVVTTPESKMEPPEITQPNEPAVVEKIIESKEPVVAQSVIEEKPIAEAQNLAVEPVREPVKQAVESKVVASVEENAAPQPAPPEPVMQNEVEKIKPTVVNVLSKDAEFFNKYVDEQVSNVISVISHNEQLPPDMIAGIKDSLLKSAKQIASQTGESVADRIQKLDVLFKQHKSEYATGSVADHIPTDKTINELLTLAENEVKTGNEENDKRFQETLNNALHNQVRHMQEMGVATSEVHIALKEEYEKIKKFYLLSAGS